MSKEIVGIDSKEGMHACEFRGLAPTGMKLTVTAVAIFRIVEGKVVEGWGVYDKMDFLKQLGVIEYKGFPEDKVS